jgi:hypothetical protein
MLGALPVHAVGTNRPPHYDTNTLSKQFVVAYNDRTFNDPERGRGYNARSVLHGQPF